MQVKPRGAPHAAEIKYVLENINNKIYGEADLKLSDMMGTFWTNFAKSGDPNGENIPAWPQFTESNQSVMYFNSNPGQQPIPNRDKLELFEEYFKTRRESK